jgi:hypothetical protein
MNALMQNKLALVLIAAALLAGFGLGVSHPATLAAEGDQAKAEVGHGGAIGVAIPSGGAAVVKGKDGFAYVITPNGVYVRAAQTGKPLELP